MARIYSETCTPATDHQSNRVKQNSLYQSDLISIRDLSLEAVQLILQTARQFKKQDQMSQELLKNKIIAHCFFEPSTRTRLSFETATLRLGGQVIGFASDECLSVQKGETLHDTIKVVAQYSNLLIIRHPQAGAARLAAQIADIPVINAGDGANQHPTQALLDFFTIEECQGKIDGLSIALVGDLKHARVIHSLAELCMLFDIRLFLVSPEMLTLPDYICDSLKKVGIRFSFHQSLEEVIPRVDIIYMTRIQQERFDHATAFQPCVLTLDMLATARSHLKILHPLPRIREIEMAIDQTPFACYFQQAANGLYVRQAVLSLLLNERGFS